MAGVSSRHTFAPSVRLPQSSPPSRFGFSSSAPLLIDVLSFQFLLLLFFSLSSFFFRRPLYPGYFILLLLKRPFECRLHIFRLHQLFSLHVASLPIPFFVRCSGFLTALSSSCCILRVSSASASCVVFFSFSYTLVHPPHFPYASFSFVSTFR